MDRRSRGEKLFLLGVSMLVAVVLTFGLPASALLLGFYIVPIILAANYYGPAGGIGFAAASTVFAMGLAKRAGIPPHDQQVVAQIVLYFLVGGFGGFMQRENMRIRRELHLSAITDELTGLYNYQHFRRRLDEEIARARRYGHPLALIMCDVNHFKKYNDAFGHLTGNFALNKIGTLIKSSIRESDIPFRYGGDEFAVILPETGAEAEVVAKRVVESVHDAFASDNIDDELRPSLSAGVVFAGPAGSLSASQLLPLVDDALYQAKRSGAAVAVVPTEKDTER